MCAYRQQKQGLFTDTSAGHTPLTRTKPVAALTPTRQPLRCSRRDRNAHAVHLLHIARAPGAARLVVPVGAPQQLSAQWSRSSTELSKHGADRKRTRGGRRPAPPRRCPCSWSCRCRARRPTGRRGGSCCAPPQHRSRSTPRRRPCNSDTFRVSETDSAQIEEVVLLTWGRPRSRSQGGQRRARARLIPRVSLAA